MKKGSVILGLIAALFLVSCGSSPNAGKMADELCETMQKITADEPMSKFDAANDVTEIRKKPEYKDVTEGEIKKAMMKKCPEGWKKYLTIKDK